MTKSLKLARVAALLFSAAGIVTVQANTLITFSVDMSAQIANLTFVPGTDTISVHGTFDGWGAGAVLVLDQDPASNGTTYTNTVNDTVDANGSVVFYKFVDSNSGIGNGGYETTADYNNRAASLPATSGATLVLPVAPFFNDAGVQVTHNVTFQVDVSQQIQLGAFTPGTSSVEVRGSFNGWSGGSTLTNNPNILVTNQYGLVTSNVWQITLPITASPWSAQDFKYVIQPGTDWESVSANNADGGGNRFFASNPNSDATLPVVNFSDEPFAPLSVVTFSVDMTAQAFYGNWNSSEPVYLSGSFNNWATGGTANQMTNNPTASNPNIYYITESLGQGSTPQYKFIYAGTGGTVWENPNPPTLGGNRFFTVPQTTSATLPTVFFSDLSLYDLLTTNVLVTFTVNMTNASQYPTGPAFDSSSDYVIVNSPAFTGSWISWDPISLAGYLLTNNPPSLVYSGTFQIPLGTAIGITYKYGIDGADNEAASGNNHLRYIRATAAGEYSFPIDTFGNQYDEPSFGELSVGPGSGNTIRLSWLGAPNVQVQTSTNLAGGSWVSHPETGGAVFSNGINSANGLVSVTNWPVTGNPLIPGANSKLFFRLMQQ